VKVTRIPRTGIRSAGAAAGLVAALVGVSACGSSSSSSSPSHAAAISGGGPAVQAAETAVANYSKLPAPIVLPAVGKPIPKQVNLDLLTVATPSIQFLNGGVLAGAKALGWNVRTITPQTAPEAYPERAVSASG